MRGDESDSGGTSAGRALDGQVGQPMFSMGPAASAPWNRIPGTVPREEPPHGRMMDRAYLLKSHVTVYQREHYQTGSRCQSLTSSKIPLVSNRFFMPTERWPLRSKLRQSADG
jgi:hypothetical protein